MPFLLSDFSRLSLTVIYSSGLNLFNTFVRPWTTLYQKVFLFACMFDSVYILSASLFLIDLFFNSILFLFWDFEILEVKDLGITSAKQRIEQGAGPQ